MRIKAQYMFKFEESKETIIREIYDDLIENKVSIDYDLFFLLFGPRSQCKIQWKEQYREDYELFKEDVINMYNEWKITYENINNNINSVINSQYNNDRWFHLDETKTSFYFMIFYKIITENNTKYIVMEFITMPGFKQDGKDKAISYIMYDQQFYFMDRRAYFQYVLAKQNPILLANENKIQIFSDNDDFKDTDMNNKVQLNEFIKHDVYNNFMSSFCYDREFSGYCSAEEAFYFNDFLLYGNGTGRKELSIYDINIDTEDGDYFCFGLFKYYQYGIEHNFELRDRKEI